jgi:hypothetical protein
VFFDNFNVVPNDTDYQAIANSVRGVFNARGETPGGYGVEVKAYDMADAKPRPVKATAPWTANAFPVSPGAPREVACCLSYYGERNLPRERGRIYVGPWTNASAVERPSTLVIQKVRDLATGLGNVGGVDVDWQLYSPTRNAYSKIKNVWVDDEWDTIRSRGLKALTRSSGATQE